MALKTLCLAFALVSAAFAAPDTRIVGGSPATIEQFPFAAAFIYHYPGAGINIQRCVGAIISSWHVLTTARCFGGAIQANMNIRAGSTESMAGGETVSIRDVIIHPDYLQSPLTADLAVVILNEPLRISNTVGISFIPPQFTNIPDGTSVEVIGWGFGGSASPQLSDLHVVNLNTVPLEECRERYADTDDVEISDTTICASRAGNYGICNGDSGAPMVIGQVLVGIGSHDNNCADDDVPDVFTRIDRFTDWILEVAVAPTRDAGELVRVAKL